MSTLPLAFTVKVIDSNDDIQFHNFGSQEDAKTFWNEQRENGKKCRFIHHRLFLRTLDIPSDQDLKSRYPTNIYTEKKNDHSYILYFKTDNDRKAVKAYNDDRIFKFRSTKKSVEKSTSYVKKKITHRAE
jgi:hypothetical protein